MRSWTGVCGWISAALLGAVGALAGCRNDPAGPGVNSIQHYPIRGTVMQVETPLGQVLLKHEAIPGFMEAMTMSYPVEDAAVLGEVHAGDRIAATLVVDVDRNGASDPRLRDVVIVAQGKPDYAPAVQYHVPAAGDAVPDFTLRNQFGKMVDLKQFRGEALLMTFVYTRCPLADYCPRMSRNFADVEHALRGDQSLYARTHLLTVSFDPGYDTPAVLRRYGMAYVGPSAATAFAHWDFAAPSAAELPRMEQYFDLGVTAQDGALQHSLSTLVIGPDGRVATFWPSNDWKPAQAVDALRRATM